MDALSWRTEVLQEWQPMEKAADVLFSLQKRGVTFRVDHDQIHCRAPNGQLSPEDFDRVLEYKSQILELLRSDAAILHWPITRRSEASEFPLTVTQRIFWSHFSGSHWRTEPFAFRISGPLDVERMRAAVHALTRRHESLRTRIAPRGAQVRQYIESRDSVDLQMVDFSRESRSAAERLMQRDLRAFCIREIDYAVDSLFEPRLVKLADEEHVLCMSIDHIITDGVSNRILKSEIWALYANCVGNDSHLPPSTSIRLGDYACWLEDIHPLWMKAHWPYWKWRLGPQARLELPCVHNKSLGGSVRFDVVRRVIDEQVAVGLEEFARRKRTFVPLVVLAAFVSSVSAILDADQLVLTVVENGRHRAELVRMVGCLMAYLQLKFEHAHRQTFGDLVDSASREYRLASAHRHFDLLSQLLPDSRCELMFNWQATAGPDEWWSEPDSAALGDLRVQALQLRLEDAYSQSILEALPMKLSLACRQHKMKTAVSLTYRADLGMSDTAERVMKKMMGTLAQLTEH